jgi:hypothetical protein
MKFLVTMKDPDTLYDAIRDAVRAEIKSNVLASQLDADEQEVVAEKREDKTREVCSLWFSDGEYLTVEIDTKAKTCTVVAVKS